MNFQCRKCQADTGIAMTGHDVADALGKAILCDDCEDAATAESADRRRDAAADRHRRRVSQVLPSALRGYRFSTSPAPQDARRAAERWAREGGRLILVGPVGTGKTGLAASAVWMRLYHHPIAWASVPTLLANLTASFDDEDRKRALSVIRGKTSLCLDDLDKFNGGDWAAAQLFAAIDNALTGNADLLITSNKTPGALAAHIGGDFGPALASRLASCEVVNVTGADHRVTTKGNQ